MAENKKHPGGRPLKFDTPEQMQEAIDAYFEKCDKATKWVATKAGPMEIPSPLAYTIEDLCVVLDISRQTLLNYEKREGYDKFFDTVIRAKRKVLASLASGSINGTCDPRAVNFNLKNNFGYRDQQEQIITDHQVNVEIINPKKD